LEGGLLCWGSGKICGGGLRGWAFSPWWPPLGSLEGGLFTGDFERWMKEGFEGLSLWELDEGSLKGGLLYWGP